MNNIFFNNVHISWRWLPDSTSRIWLTCIVWWQSSVAGIEVMLNLNLFWWQREFQNIWKCFGGGKSAYDEQGMRKLLCTLRSTFLAQKRSFRVNCIFGDIEEHLIFPESLCESQRREEKILTFYRVFIQRKPEVTGISGVLVENCTRSIRHNSCLKKCCWLQGRN